MADPLLNDFGHDRGQINGDMRGKHNYDVKNMSFVEHGLQRTLRLI